ncbi:MAG: hypothetical protein ACFE9I_13495 [Candidatus Hermodarchaeota archaeon]
MNLWIIYSNTFGYSKMISEIFESQLEEYFNVSVGNAEIVKPSLVIDEKPDFIIFGEFIRKNSLNPITKWIEEFYILLKFNNISIKKVATYYIVPGNLDINDTGVKTMSKYFPAESIFSKPLVLKINTFNGSLDKETYTLITKYVKHLIIFFFN